MSGRLGDEPLLEACLRDQRFDTQVESSRGDWLWRMVRAVGAADRFRVPILHALYDLSDDRSASQLCELARHYAEAGDDAFRTLLYEIVEQKPFAHSPWLGEEEVITLNGERGFLFAARVRGRLLAGRAWGWDDRSLIDLAGERFGEANVGRLLEAATDEAVSRFREHWRHEQQKNAGHCKQASDVRPQPGLRPRFLGRRLIDPQAPLLRQGAGQLLVGGAGPGRLAPTS
jgi:hypothetical protein